MNPQENSISKSPALEAVQTEAFTFSIILKYWKKSSKSFEIKTTLNHCLTEDKFVKFVKEKFQVKSSHCLEEIWVLQKADPHERKLEWIKTKNGRIRLQVPDSYKAFLLKKSVTKGYSQFEDPSYED